MYPLPLVIILVAFSTVSFQLVNVEALPFPAATTSLLLTPEAPSEIEPVQPRTPAPAMVPVSSTVIPVTNAKSPSARQATQHVQYTRRFRFFDKSSKPDTPIRLITKNTNLKTLYNST
ncbi:unnamed protein product [Allacma fusca]|uniref:Uncharacterized protein n=1 Tax=Allacma fusca TaxID=39272 RepID=A0A8J2LPX6_9HEXA|nr:unnamed protein product [Allacma fusca]